MLESMAPCNLKYLLVCFVFAACLDFISADSRLLGDSTAGQGGLMADIRHCCSQSLCVSLSISVSVCLPSIALCVSALPVALPWGGAAVKQVPTTSCFAVTKF